MMYLFDNVNYTDRRLIRNGWNSRTLLSGYISIQVVDGEDQE